MINILLDPHIFSLTQLQTRNDVGNLRIICDALIDSKRPINYYKTSSIIQSYRKHINNFDQIPQCLAKSVLIEFFKRSKLLSEKDLREGGAPCQIPPCEGCPDVQDSVIKGIADYLITSDIDCELYPRQNIDSNITPTIFSNHKVYNLLKLSNSKQLIIDRIGTVWDTLLDNSQAFLTTGITIWFEHRNDSRFDFSSAVIVISKTLEVELVRILDNFLTFEDVRELLETYNLQDLDKRGSTLATLLYHFKSMNNKVSLGGFNYLLNMNRITSDVLETKWKSYISSQKNYNIITGRSFRDKINTISNKFRNDGAHSAFMYYDDCSSLINLILGNADDTARGMLSLLCGE